ncbi:hypothetical protein [Streptomyces sp. TLI_146]|uniref:hypothetical protein n=1 Tax=Streptomyces sp. TLI_146 TaxID=1938858 RepID=UPI000CC5DECA|nr:hypothetical protein [Streptomyces sp. TLI_146]PKV90151.1 hypothetical protein BX283_7831 [Streptomyces sp. TLI_146]
MTETAAPRRLFNALESYERHDAFAEVLEPWLRSSGAGLRERLAPLAVYGAWRRESYEFGDLLELAYALLRVNDVLLLGFQPDLPPGAEQVLKHYLHMKREWPRITLDQYLTLFTALGMTPVGQGAFDPFWHEIVSVEQAKDPDTPITVTATVWPGLMFGELLFSRAGVRVRAGTSHAVAGVADRYPVHGVFIRRHREAICGSEFCGSNSQWKTDFRRDYRTATADHFNVDGEKDIDGPGEEPHMTPEERRDLLRHRGLVRWPADPAVHPYPSPIGWRLTIPRKTRPGQAS